MRLTGLVDTVFWFAMGALSVLFIQDVSDRTFALREWQGLAGALIALVAAIWTINQMRSSDALHREKRDDEKATEARLFAKRTERLKSDILAAAYVTRSISDAVSAHPDYLDIRWDEQLPQWKAYASRMVSISKRSSFAEARRYFTADVDDAFELAMEEIRDFEEALRMLSETWYKWLEYPELWAATLEGCSKNVVSQGDLLVKHYVLFAGGVGIQLKDAQFLRKVVELLPAITDG